MNPLALSGVGSLSSTVAVASAAASASSVLSLAAPSLVLGACRRTLDQLLSNPKAPAMTELHRAAFFALRERVAAAAERHGEAVRFAVMTVGLLDTLLLDEMAPKRRLGDLGNFYAREHGYSKKLILTIDEGARAICGLQECGWTGIDGIASISHACSRRFVLDPWRDLRREGELLQQLAAAAYAFLPLTEVCIPFRCGEAAVLGCYELQQGEDARGDMGSGVWRETMAGAELPPQSPLPRQEYWRALLLSGIELFSGPEPAVPARFATTAEASGAILRRLIDAAAEDRAERWRRGALRRLAVHVRNPEDLARTERFAAGHVRHYARLLRVEGEEPQVLLTRSGVSANEVAIAAASRIVGREASAWVHPGWYYENRASLVTRFARAPQIGRAQALFVPLLATVPERVLALDRAPEEGPIQAREAVAGFLQCARHRSDLRHCLVIDKTAHLLWSLAEWGESLPENVTLIETASLTKQQRGARNYFFGLLAHRGPSWELGIVEREAREQFAALTPFGVANLPRLTASEVREAQERSRKLSDAFALGFELQQRGVPWELRWSAERHGVFTYLLPPLERILAEARRECAGAAADRTLFVRDASRPTPFYYFREETPFRVSLPEDLGFLRELGIDFGDSFGLNESRMTVIRYLMRNALSVSNPAGRPLLEIFALRIAPGNLARPEELWHQGAELGEYIAGRMRVMQDAERERQLGSGPAR